MTDQLKKPIFRPLNLRVYYNKVMYGGREVQNSFERKKSLSSAKKMFKTQKKSFKHKKMFQAKKVFERKKSLSSTKKVFRAQ